MRRFSSLVLSCAVLGALPAAAGAARMPSVPSPSAVEIIDMAELLKELGIKRKASEIKAVTSDPSGKHVGIVFAGRDGSAAVYKGGTLMLQAPLQMVPDSGVFPTVFRVTDDGKLLHAVNPYALYLDAKRVTSEDNRYSFYNGVDSATYEKGVLTFPEHSSIREYRPATGKTTVLFSHPGETTVFLRRRGKHVVYTTTDEKGNHRIYRDGERIYDGFIDNPANFVVAKDGKALFFVQGDDGTYRVHRDDEGVVMSGMGLGAFLLQDPHQKTWVVSYRVTGGHADIADYGTQRFDITIVRDGKTVNTPPLGNMEGWIAFSGTRYAFRGSPAGSPAQFFLYVDGKKTGEAFPFLSQRAGDGVLFANGKTYMRNAAGGRWSLYEDGKKILADRVKDAWHVTVNGKTVRVFATR